MTNEDLKAVIGDWFPNPEAYIISDVTEKTDSDSDSEEAEQEPAAG